MILLVEIIFLCTSVNGHVAPVSVISRKKTRPFGNLIVKRQTTKYHVLQQTQLSLAIKSFNSDALEFTYFVDDLSN